MGKIVGDEPCPQCRNNGRDKTGNHLMVFEDGGKYCNREGCGYTEKAGTVNTEKISKKEYKSVAEIKELPSADLPERKIRKGICDAYGVRVEYSETDGAIAKHYYPYVSNETQKLFGYKVRNLPKKFWGTVSFKNVSTQFFGQYKFNGSRKKLLVVSGELDVLSAFQMFEDSRVKYAPAIVGFPQGECVKPFTDNKEFIDKFEEIILCPDQDAQGKKSAMQIANALGDKLKIMDISEKDPSDMLVKDKQREFISSFYDAKKFKPSGFIDVKEAKRKAQKMPEWGLSFPWPSLTNLTYGIRRGEGYYIGAGVKIGKSEFVNELIYHLINVHDVTPCIIKPEEEGNKTIRKIAGKKFNKQFHKPDGEFTQEELSEAVNSITDSSVENIYDSYGTADWEEVKTFIRYAVSAEKCRDVIIDPITCFTDGISPSDVDVLLKKIAREIAVMAKDLNFTYYIFCHLNAPPPGNKQHEEGGKVKSSQFAGSRGMIRACYYTVGIQRNKRDADEIKANTSKFILLDDREFGNVGDFEVFYNKETGRYLEPNTEGDFV